MRIAKTAAALGPLALLLTVSSAGARSMRLSWTGEPGAEYYEVEVGTSRIRADSASSRIDVPDSLAPGGIRARVRAVFSDRKASEWHPLRTVDWRAPRLPQRIRVDSGEAGSKRVQWEPPPGSAPGEKFSYRVRIAGYRDGIVLHEGIVPEAEFVLPRLPGGDYVLTVSAAGVPETGTLSPENSPAASSLIEAEAIEFKTEEEGAPDVIALTEQFAPGFISRSFLELHAGGPVRQVFLRQDLGYNWESGFGLLVGAPLVLSEIGDRRPGSSVPRLGGLPFPSIRVGKRLLGDSASHLFLAGLATVPLDSSGATDGQPFVFQGLLGGRLTFGSLGFDAALAAGSTAGTETPLGGDLLPYPIVHASFAPYYVLNPRLRAGLLLSLGIRGEIRESDGNVDTQLTPEATSLTFQPFADYAVSEHVYLKGSIAILSISGDSSGTQVAVLTGAGIVF